jgi:hypothetical protein
MQRDVVTKLSELNNKKVSVNTYKNSKLLNYDGKRLNLQLSEITLTKLGLYPSKSILDDVSQFNEKNATSFLVSLDDMQSDDLKKLRELDTFLKNNEKLKKDYFVENAKYIPLINDTTKYVKLFLRTQYGENTITTNFVNKNGDTPDISDIESVREYLRLNNKLQFILTGTFYNYTNNKTGEYNYGVNLKIEVCRFDLSNTFDEELERENSKLFFQSYSNKSLSLDFTSLDFKKLYAETIVSKKNNENVYVIRYKSDTKDELHLELPQLLLSSYGTPGPEVLKMKDGTTIKNKYYSGEAGRRSIKIPIPTEMKELHTKLAELDKYFKNNSKLRDVAQIDEDCIEKYNPILRKPLKSKDPNAPVKPLYIKLKFTKNRDDTIGTKFIMDNAELDIKNVEDLDQYLRLNMNLDAKVRFGNIWTKPSGEWGVTLQLVSLVMHKTKSMRSLDFVEDMEDDDESPKQSTKFQNFVESDGEEEVKSSKTTKVVKSSKAQVVEESSDEEVKPVKVTKTPVKITKSSKAEASDDEEEVKPVKVAPKAPIKPTKTTKIAEVSSDDEEVTVAKTVKMVESDDDEPAPVRKVQPPKQLAKLTSTKSKKSTV